MNEPFRVYGSYWESLQDHAALLRSTSYSTGVCNYSGTWKSQTTSFYDATAYLTGRYATDPTYNQKLNWLIETYNLTSFDTPSQVVTTYVEPEQTSYVTETATVETGYTETAYTEPAYASSGTHTVVAGDTLWDIANAYGTSVDQLMANNGLTDGLIVVGQQLVV
jgi:LysM repeat protein